MRKRKRKIIRIRNRIRKKIRNRIRKGTNPDSVRSSASRDSCLYMDKEKKTNESYIMKTKKTRQAQPRGGEREIQAMNQEEKKKDGKKHRRKESMRDIPRFF